jgi:NAD(P)-dependent dehydrogenase (short-subunit alcohol dehydrogenase family)
MTTPVSRSLEGKIAIVTGGGGGIGNAICVRFARDGARVYSADLRPGGTELPEHVRYIATDVTEESSIRALIAQVGAETGRLDILVNAAGIEIEKSVENTSLEECHWYLSALQACPSPDARGRRRINHQHGFVRRLHR